MAWRYVTGVHGGDGLADEVGQRAGVSQIRPVPHLFGGEDRQPMSLAREWAALRRPDLQQGPPAAVLGVPRHQKQHILQPAQFALDGPVLGRPPDVWVFTPVPEPP